jgi:hypothetical protein
LVANEENDLWDDDLSSHWVWVWTWLLDCDEMHLNVGTDVDVDVDAGGCCSVGSSRDRDEAIADICRCFLIKLERPTSSTRLPVETVRIVK